MQKTQFFPCAVAALILLALTGCTTGRKDPATGPEGDFVTGTPLPERQEGVTFLGSNVDRARFRPVYFGFDSFAIGSGERGKIDEAAAFMKSEGNHLIIAGYTDERGTPDYNRGLGERRAQVVREALIRAGAEASKIQTVSFGAEMPAASGSGESAWAKNRRAEFGVVR